MTQRGDQAEEQRASNDNASIAGMICISSCELVRVALRSSRSNESRSVPTHTNPVPIYFRQQTLRTVESSLRFGYTFAMTNASTLCLLYLRTSSATNVNGDSSLRQRDACERYAASQGLEIVQEFYDAAVSGADAVQDRPGFAAMLDRIEGNGVRLILVEDASRFARDLLVQEAGLAMLASRGVRLVTASGDDLTATDDPMRKMLRQIVGAVMEAEKARLVAKLKAARDRKAAQTGKPCGGLPRDMERQAALIELRAEFPDASMRLLSEKLAGRGFLTTEGKPVTVQEISRTLRRLSGLPAVA
jgi:DNA invertase Pin-like site-specific DNA recombinase